MGVSVTIKFEVALKASERTKAMKEKEKEKEAKGVVASVQRKGEKQFVVLTVSFYLLLPLTRM
jgi:3-phosphoinositide dependent protein kinase-1